MADPITNFFYQFLRMKIDTGFFDPENDPRSEFKLQMAAQSANLSSKDEVELLVYWAEKYFTDPQQ